MFPLYFNEEESEMIIRLSKTIKQTLGYVFKDSVDALAVGDLRKFLDEKEERPSICGGRTIDKIVNPVLTDTTPALVENKDAAPVARLTIASAPSSINFYFELGLIREKTNILGRICEELNFSFEKKKKGPTNENR